MGLMRVVSAKLGDSFNCEGLFYSGQLKNVVCGQDELYGFEQEGLSRSGCS